MMSPDVIVKGGEDMVCAGRDYTLSVAIGLPLILHPLSSRTDMGVPMVFLLKTLEMMLISSEERRNMDGPLWSFGDTWILGILVVQVVSTMTGLLLWYVRLSIRQKNNLWHANLNFTHIVRET